MLLNRKAPKPFLKHYTTSQSELTRELHSPPECTSHQVTSPKSVLRNTDILLPSKRRHIPHRGNIISTFVSIFIYKQAREEFLLLTPELCVHLILHSTCICTSDANVPLPVNSTSLSTKSTQQLRQGLFQDKSC